MHQPSRAPSLLLAVAVLCSLALTAFAAPASAAGKEAAPSSEGMYTAAGGLPTMWSGDAKSYARQTLAWRFGSAFRYGHGKRISCGTRLSRTKRRCDVRFGIGDTSYRGRVTPYYSYRGNDPWYAHYNILRTDEYCLHTGGSRDRCTKRYRGTY
jgi:hypothetical protein